jgi:hypothetical protein
MTPEEPDDGLEAKRAAAKTEGPEVYAINRGQSGWTLSRRSLLGAAALAATASRRGDGAVCAFGAVAHAYPVRSIAISPDGRRAL